MTGPAPDPLPWGWPPPPRVEHFPDAPRPGAALPGTADVGLPSLRAVLLASLRSRRLPGRRPARRTGRLYGGGVVGAVTAVVTLPVSVVAFLGNVDQGGPDAPGAVLPLGVPCAVALWIGARRVRRGGAPGLLRAAAAVALAAMVLLGALSATLTGDDADGALAFGVAGAVLPLVTLWRALLRDRGRHGAGF